MNVPGVSRGIDGLDVDALRQAIRDEYTMVAEEPAHGFHFHTGQPLASLLGYHDELLRGGSH